MDVNQTFCVDHFVMYIQTSNNYVVYVICQLHFNFVKNLAISKQCDTCCIEHPQSWVEVGGQDDSSQGRNPKDI